MEYVEFFFGDFWHWFGLVILAVAIRGGALISIDKSNNKKVEKKD